jgi:hypothetical protein
MDIALPKWPAFLVKGDSVTEERAAEILIRTDYGIPDFRYAGNDKYHAQLLSNLFGIPEEYEDGVRHPEKRTKAQEAKQTDEMRIRWASMEALEKKLGKLSLNYLQNSWIVSCYIGGPHGWCNWDGEIGNNDTNIGKWPSVEEVTKDWEQIATAFPFLNLECQLCNHEAGYPHENQVSGPIVKFVVKKGKVTVTSQDPSKDTYIVGPRESSMSSILSRIGGSCDAEHGISVDDLRNKLKRLYGDIPQYVRTKPKANA